MSTTIRPGRGLVRADYASATRAMRAADHLASELGMRARLVRLTDRGGEPEAIARRLLLRRTSQRALLGAAAGTAAALVTLVFGGLNIQPHEVALVALLGSACAGIVTLAAPSLCGPDPPREDACYIVAWAEQGRVPDRARAILRREGAVDIIDLE